MLTDTIGFITIEKCAEITGTNALQTGTAIGLLGFLLAVAWIILVLAIDKNTKYKKFLKEKKLLTNFWEWEEQRKN